MSDDSFSETTSESWFSRIIESIKGILFGIVLFLGSFVLLWYNEGRTVKQQQALNEGSASVVSIDSSNVTPDHQGKLVHLSGKATTTASINDPEFGISAPALKLIRSVEMYQWQENTKSTTEKNVGGSKETTKTYSYDKSWSNTPIASSDFNQPNDHQNPAFPYQEKTITATPITVGAFTLPQGLTEKINQTQALPITLETLPTDLKSKVKLHEGYYYLGKDPSNPQIGDLRIKFNIVPSTDVTVVAKQNGQQLEAFTTRNGNSILLLECKPMTAEAMFAHAQQNNHIFAWVLRVIGLLVMTFGLFLILNPIAVMADVLPFLGSILEAGIGLIAFLISLVLSITTIAIAWIAYRPLLGISILLAAATIIWFIKRKVTTTPAQAP